LAAARVLHLGSIQQLDDQLPFEVVPKGIGLLHSELTGSEPHYAWPRFQPAVQSFNATRTCDPGPIDWSHLSIELDSLRKLEQNWDGEGAKAISIESAKTAASLLRIAREVFEQVMDIRNSFESLLSTLLGSRPGLTSTSYSTLASPGSFNVSQIGTAGIGLIGVACDAIRKKSSPIPAPKLYPRVDGDLSLKWAYDAKELDCTAMGESVEVIRWSSPDLFESDGLWDLAAEQTREHFEWLIR
jgi:hypothetical protein